MNIYIIGRGMYVTGRGTDEFGTILPAIIEWKRSGKPLGKIFLVGADGKNSPKAIEKVKVLQNIARVQFDLEVFPKNNSFEDKVYLQVLKDIKQPACAFVSVPDHLHYEVTNTCINQGLHTMVVKPFTPSVGEAKKLISLAKNNNVYGAVEFHKRLDRQNRILKDEFESGKLGVPLYTWTEYSQRKSIPNKIFRSWVEKTNILQYLGVHYIDIIRFVTGAIPNRVLATGQMVWLKEKGLNVYDSIQCMVEWETPDEHTFNQTLLVNWIDPENSSSMSDQKLKFVGTKGRYEGDQKERGLRLLYDNQVLQEPNPDYCRAYKTADSSMAWEGYGIDNIVNFLNDVEDLILGKVKPQNLKGNRPTFKESLFSTAVIEAARQSLNEGGNWVKINI